MSLRIAVLGLSITSSWGNGHATTYRALLRQVAARGHRVTFLERDVPWYAAHRDLPQAAWADIRLYASLDELRQRHQDVVAGSDVVIVGSYVPEGCAVARWVHGTARGRTAFYDIDTPVTLAKLERGDHEYLEPGLIPGFDAYLSFTGGPTLQLLERRYGSPRAAALYCSVDPDLYHPADDASAPTIDLGYLGTYSPDRQPGLDELLLAPARAEPLRRFVVAGAQYPAQTWPANVIHREHVPPHEHRAFYTSQRFTLSITRADMRRAGWSPSVRLFEAAACGVPIISDPHPGIDEVLTPGREIVIACSCGEVRTALAMDEGSRRRMAAAARARVLAEHTAAHRAATLEAILASLPYRHRTASGALV